MSLTICKAVFTGLSGVTDRRTTRQTDAITLHKKIKFNGPNRWSL